MKQFKKIMSQSFLAAIFGLALVGCAISEPAPSTPVNSDAAAPASGYELLRTLSAHYHPVNSVNFANNGLLLASASGKKDYLSFYHEILIAFRKNSSLDPTFDEPRMHIDPSDYRIQLWDGSSGKRLHTLSEHDKRVNSVAFSPSGAMLASGGDDHTVKLWAPRSGKLLRTLQGHSNYVESVAFAPDGKTLVSGSYDQTIKLWNAQSGELIQTLTGHTDSVRSLAFSTDGDTLASGSWDRKIKLWNAQSGELLRTLDGASYVAFASDGNTLAGGGIR